MTITQMALLLSCLHMKAQGTPSAPDVPPTPQAVAFNRLGDYQVNNNYGAPDISIPLFEIDFHGFKIPLSLHYEASPMKSGYNYDVTGWGWTLSGNSCVSRTIKDRADEYGVMFNNPFTLDSFQDTNGNPRLYVNYANVLARLNFQYDSYNIVLPSGRTIPFFMYKLNGVMKYELMSLDNHVKIECNYSTSEHSINSFTVTDENGVIYDFTIADKASNGFDNDPNALSNVTWLLSDIYIPAKGYISYEYNNEISIYTQDNIGEPTYRVSRLMSQMQEDWGRRKFDVGLTLQNYCPRYKMRFIKRISYGPTTVDFNYYADNKHMKEIVVSENNTTIKKFSLDINDRFLTSLVFSGTNNNDKLEYDFGYQNQSMNLNDTIVKYIDYWGNICYSKNRTDLGNFNMYFNNEEDGNYLNQQQLREQLAIDNIAKIIDNKEDDPYYYYKVKLQSTTNGDTRQPTPPQYHGVLSSITYPNGGHTTFTWENHRFPTATAADGDMVFDRRRQRIIEGGGFRIKSVKNYKADGTIASEDHYRYGFTYGDIAQRHFPLPLPDTYNPNDHIGCGEAVVDPNLLTFMTFSYYKSGNAVFNPPLQLQLMAVGQNSAVRQMINIQGSATWWDAYFSASTFRSLLDGRRPVVYPEITVYHGDPDVPSNSISKTVYKYDIYSYTHNPYTYYQSSVNQSTPPDTAYFERLCYFPFGDIPGMIRDNYEAPLRHLLKSKSDYSYNTSNGTWEQVSEEQYSYSEERIEKNGYTYNTYRSRECRSNYVAPLGNGQWLGGYALRDFYVESTQCLGRSTLTGKSTTTLRQGGTRTLDNKQSEVYSYLYSGVLKSKDYHVLPYGIRNEFNDVLDKTIENSYVGENGVTLFVGQEDPSSLADTLAVVLAAMRSNNMLASMASTETFTIIPDVIMDSGTKINYNFFGNKILPYKIYESNGEQYEGSVMILSYDSYGNPTEILDLKTGVYSVYLWDIYGRYLIAMIKDATLSQIQNITQLRAVSSQTRHSMLQTTFPNALVQTWDYKPLVGVSSHTDVNGQTFLYEYDGLGRLKTEKRVVNGVQSPEILHQYEYNYLN
jgi:hypothetical protein